MPQGNQYPCHLYFSIDTDCETAKALDILAYRVGAAALRQPLQDLVTCAPGPASWRLPPTRMRRQMPGLQPALQGGIEADPAPGCRRPACLLLLRAQTLKT